MYEVILSRRWTGSWPKQAESERLQMCTRGKLKHPRSWGKLFFFFSKCECTHPYNFALTQGQKTECAQRNLLFLKWKESCSHIKIMFSHSISALERFLPVNNTINIFQWRKKNILFSNLSELFNNYIEANRESILYVILGHRWRMFSCVQTSVVLLPRAHNYNNTQNYPYFWLWSHQ